jgi:hypothetical protein
MGELMYRSGREARGIEAEEESQEKSKQKKKFSILLKLNPDLNWTQTSSVS